MRIISGSDLELYLLDFIMNISALCNASGYATKGNDIVGHVHSLPRMPCFLPFMSSFSVKPSPAHLSSSVWGQGEKGRTKAEEVCVCSLWGSVDMIPREKIKRMTWLQLMGMRAYEIRKRNPRKYSCGLQIGSFPCFPQITSKELDWIFF